MVTYNAKETFNEKANFNKVIFGEGAPLLEVELNELQDIIADQFKRFGEGVFKRDGFVTLNSDFKANGLLTVSGLAFLDGAFVRVSSIGLTLATGDKAYLAYKQNTVTSTSIVKEYGNQLSSTNIPNHLKDTRVGDETTRRKQLVYTILKTNTDTSYKYIPLGEVKTVSGALSFTPNVNSKVAVVSDEMLAYVEYLQSTFKVDGYHVPDVRTLNGGVARTPIQYRALQKAGGVIHEFGTASTYGLTNVGQYVMVETIIAYIDTTAGVAIQRAYPLDVSYAKYVYTRRSTGTTVNEVWDTNWERNVTLSEVDSKITTATNNLNTSIANAVKAHADNKSNPHGVTKAQVGLSSVENYGIATQAEAEAGTATNKYMTPLRTKEAISKLASGAITTHTSDKNNPHGVTKAQVGLGNVDNTNDLSKPISTAMQTALNGKVSTYASVDGKDMNTIKETGFYYGYNMTNSAHTSISTFIVMKYSADWITQIQYVTNDKAYMRSWYNANTWSAWKEIPTDANVATQTNKGLMSETDKKKLDGIAEGANNYSLPTATASVLGGVKTGANISNVSGTISVPNASTTTKGVVQLSDILTSTATDLGLTANQGRVLKGIIDTFMTRKDNPHAVTTTQVNYLPYYSRKVTDDYTKYPIGLSTMFVRAEEGDGWQSYGTVLTVQSARDGGGGTLQIYVPYGDNHGGLNLQFRTWKYQATAWSAWSIIETTAGAQAKVDAHANNKSNPHAVTKAQVGLGSVENYGIATTAEAKAGTVNNKYVTPLRVAELVKDSELIGRNYYNGSYRVKGGSAGTYNTNDDGSLSITTTGSVAVAFYFDTDLDSHVDAYNEMTKTIPFGENITMSFDYEVVSGAVTIPQIYFHPQMGYLDLSTVSGSIAVGKKVRLYVTRPFTQNTSGRILTHLMLPIGSYKISKFKIERGSIPTPWCPSQEDLLAIRGKGTTDLNSHKNDKNNPHGVTKAQVGLGNVDNTSDLNKPVSTAMQNLVNKFVKEGYIDNSASPRTVTKSVSSIVPAYSATIHANTGVITIRIPSGIGGILRFEFVSSYNHVNASGGLVIEYTVGYNRTTKAFYANESNIISASTTFMNCFYVSPELEFDSSTGDLLLKVYKRPTTYNQLLFNATSVDIGGSPVVKDITATYTDTGNATYNYPSKYFFSHNEKLNSRVISTDTDLNTITGTGMYTLNFVGTATNNKPVSQHSLLIVSGDVDTPTQILIGDTATNDTLAYRRNLVKTTGVWSAWTTLKFTDTLYTHPTTDGNLHVPATGTGNNGKVLKAGSTAGALSWGTLGASDVGLGSVNNWGIASTAEAQAGTADNRYMTPLKVKDAISALGLPIAGSVTTNSDFNAITAPGMYNVTDIANASNKPPNAYGYGVLLVMRGNTPTAGLTQLYVTHVAPADELKKACYMYVRTGWGGATANRWSTWSKIVNTDDIDSVINSSIQKTGGTMTGALTNNVSVTSPTFKTGSFEIKNNSTLKSLDFVYNG